MPTRTEHDSMGTMQVPENALYGAQTARALDNFPISGIRFPRPFLRALGLIKEHAARVNHDLELLEHSTAMAIMAGVSPSSRFRSVRDASPSV